MNRTVHVSLLVLLLSAWSSGCGNRPKDQIPAKIQPPPKEQPASGQSDLFPKPKK
jgi:hypothetical protein